MTHYPVHSPVLLLSFPTNTGPRWEAISPLRYGPHTTLDVYGEFQYNDHPMMNAEYSLFLQRAILSSIGNRRFLDLQMDFHCTIPVYQRTNTAYLVVWRQTGSVFSPLFFLEADAIRYHAILTDGFPEVDDPFAIYEVPHRSV